MYYFQLNQVKSTHNDEKLLESVYYWIKIMLDCMFFWWPITRYNLMSKFTIICNIEQILYLQIIIHLED